MTWPFKGLRRGSFDFVKVDPAWHFNLWSAQGEEKSPQAQYDTMTIEEVCELPVRDLLKPTGGAGWLWTTWPMVAAGLHTRVLDAWGVFGKTGGSWAKRTGRGLLRWGPGFIHRTVCEPYIIFSTSPTNGSGLRGRDQKNMIETLDAIQFDGLAREHSRKPDEAYRICEVLTPGAKRADVFARQRRHGWTGFGRELDTWPRETLKQQLEQLAAMRATKVVHPPSGSRSQPVDYRPEVSQVDGESGAS